MAPRPPESFEAFVARLTKALNHGATEVRFGGHHVTHAVCVEAGALRIRRLEHTPEEAEAYLREHGIFMPEHAEEMSKPRTLVLEAATIEELTHALRQRWPLGG
jgi:hypothetical protein